MRSTWRAARSNSIKLRKLQFEPRRDHFGHRGGRQAAGHRRDQPGPVGQERAGCCYQHPVTSLQRRHGAIHERQPSALGKRVVDTRATGHRVFYLPDFRGRVRPAIAQLTQRNPDQLCAQQRAGGPPERHRSPTVHDNPEFQRLVTTLQGQGGPGKVKLSMPAQIVAHTSQPLRPIMQAGND